MSVTSLFSVVVTTYNQAHLVNDCLDSILRQGYDPLDIVLYDDASKDDSFGVLMRWKDCHPELDVTVLKNSQNRGTAYTINQALRATKGKYVKFIAGDDVFADGALAKVASYFDTHDNVDCIMSDVLFFSDFSDIAMGKTPLRLDAKEHGFFEKSAQEQFLSLTIRNNVLTPGIFLRRSLLVDIDFIDPDFKKLEDYHTWLKITKAGHCIRKLSEPLVYWRRHEGSVSYTVWHRHDSVYKRDELEIYRRYVMPYYKTLPLAYKLHATSHLLYMHALLKLGVSRRSHKIAGVFKLLDPIWMYGLGAKFFSRKK